MFGDLTRKTRSTQERALWEKHPESKVYYANYVRLLLEDYKEKDLGISFDYLEKEIETRKSNGIAVPFELYHLRSELHQALGNQELSERDRRSAEESLAAEFAGV